MPGVCSVASFTNKTVQILKNIINMSPNKIMMAVLCYLVKPKCHSKYYSGLIFIMYTFPDDLVMCLMWYYLLK